MSAVMVGLPRRLVTIELDGVEVRVPEGSTLLEAAREQGTGTPTLCYLENLTPVNACRVCVVEVEGQRTLAPACSRPVEDGMVVRTDSERVRLSRRMVLELLASSVDLSLASDEIKGWMDEYGVQPDRYGPPRPPAGPGERDALRPGHHEPPDGWTAATVAQPAKVQDSLYVRDYSKCILCYKCVEACGEDAQNTFAIAVAGRGFDARISTEFNVELPDSACVYCGNCIGVCPTGALIPKSEWDLRQQGEWAPERQHTTETICSFCGVGCSLELTVQDNRIVRADSPLDHSVTQGHLCVKGRFGFQHVQNYPDEPLPGT
ncbi:2Fe-2S iron-sulfur cluster-binding protein [Egibacter rhizosphaerae]|nr:2Fe-2S iron-sulfur cluster-binding protein [Egibacter rhizosphaerae]